MSRIKTILSSSRLFSKGSKNLGGGVVDDATFNRMTSSFKSNKYLIDDVQFEYSAPLIFQMNELKDDVDDLHNHLSESLYTNGETSFGGSILVSSHITASGNISSSGTITMLTASIGGGVFTSASLTAGGGGGAVSAVTNGSNNRVATFSSADALNGEANLLFDGSILEIGGKLKVSSHITASGNISGSSTSNITVGGSITANEVVAGAGTFSANIGANGNIVGDDSTNITGIADIDASAGTVTAGRVNTTGGVHVGGTSDPGTNNLIVDGTSTLTGDVTSGGDISSSGDVYGNNLHVGNVNSSGIGTGGPTQILIGSAQGGPSGSIKFQSSNASITIRQAKDFNDGALTFTKHDGTDIVLMGSTLVADAELEVVGDISASGTGYFEDVIINDDLDVDGTTNLDNTDIDGTLTVSSRTVFEPETFSLNDTTPEVRLGRVFLTNNNTTTAITAFDNGTAGQIIHIIHMDNNTDYTNGTNLKLRRGFDHTSGQTDDTITFVCVDGTKWVELNRSDNS